MKNIVIVLLLLVGTLAQGQNKNAKATMEVDGVCFMCKQRIEKAAVRTKGVKSAVWNMDTHILSLIFDERKTALDSIQANILAVGHDTEGAMASEEAYNSVHDCCKYRDEELQIDHKNQGKQ